MPVRMASLKTGEATLTTHWKGESLEIVYRPHVWTPEWEELLSGDDGEKGSDSLALALEELIVSWDVLDENDEPMEIKADNLVVLPSPFLLFCMKEIWDDMTPGEVRRRSGSGSRRRG